MRVIKHKILNKKKAILKKIKIKKKIPNTYSNTCEKKLYFWNKCCYRHHLTYLEKVSKFFGKWSIFASHLKQNTITLSFVNLFSSQKVMFIDEWVFWISCLNQLTKAWQTDKQTDRQPWGRWARVLPWVWVLGEGRQAAGVHVAPDIDVHGGVRLGQLCGKRDPLSSQRRDRGPGQREPWHASSLLKASVEKSHGTKVNERREREKEEN